jgi:putative transposase
VQQPMTFYRRNLPHWHPDGRAIFLTWRLYGSLPKDFLGRHAAWHSHSWLCSPKAEKHECRGKSVSATQTPGRRFLTLDAVLDRAAYGPRWLQQPEVAQRVQDAILQGARLEHYTLYVYVIMPNHAHILIQPHLLLARITGSLKGASARRANLVLGRVGRHFWQDESFDHWVRNETEFERICSYIELNPVTAGLAAKPEDWPWSSAATRTKAQARAPVPLSTFSC